MDKICIYGEDWVRLHDVCDILRTVQDEPVFDNTDKVMRQIAKLMFHDEIEAAETEEKKEALLEFPGDFLVVTDLGYKNPNGKRFIYFKKFSDGVGISTDNAAKAMVFEYKSMADNVAKKLGDGWRSVCVGVEDGRITRRVGERIKAFMAVAKGVEVE